MPSFLLRKTGIFRISPALRFHKREPIKVRKLSTGLLKPKDKERSWLKMWWLPLTTLLVALIATPWLIGPACPRKIVIATGSRTGAYFAFAQQYREILARDGIDLEIRNTAGSIENTQLLMADDSGVSLAIIQGGTATDKSMPELRSLASLYKEPIWVFYRGDKTVQRLTDLRGKRIAIGAQGSGTRAVALDLLQENHIATSDGTNSATKSVSLNTEQSVAAIKSGDVDAAFFVISPHAPVIRDLLETEGVRLMSFHRADAYHRQHPYLSRVTLEEGVLDLANNTPAEDSLLLAPTANLVASDNLHPALVPLLVKAANEIHKQGSILQEPGEFPSVKHVEYPMNAVAGRYFKSGPSILYRYLPFWAAARINQMKLFLLPLCTLLLPLLKTAPPLYRWRIRSRIYRWYRVLREVDQKLRQPGETASLAEDIDVLKTLESELAEVSVPLSYMEEFYNLRLHTAFVLERLQQRQRDETPNIRAAA
jgi:uncharacterized protein